MKFLIISILIHEMLLLPFILRQFYLLYITEVLKENLYPLQGRSPAFSDICAMLELRSHATLLGPCI